MAKKNIDTTFENALSRRKEPQQRRSELTVLSIKQAAIEIAKTDGFLNLTTREIAERAGISVGSLYQYFPTVEAVLLAIYEETAARVAGKFREKMLNFMHSSMEVVCAKSLQLLLKEYEDNQLILHRMTIEVPQLMLTSGVASFDRLVRAGLRVYLMQHRPLNSKEIERVSFFVEIVIIGSLRNYLTSKPSGLSKHEFLEDLKKLLVHYVNSQNWSAQEKPFVS